MSELTSAQKAKLRILARGLKVSECANRWIIEKTQDPGLSSADYASTSGVILKLEGNVWVNAPFEELSEQSNQEAGAVLDYDGEGLLVSYENQSLRAEYCLQPRYHRYKTFGSREEFLMVTHGDRARLSPLNGCSMSCEFCNIPFEERSQAYHLFPAEECVASIKQALHDPVQPAQHLMVSGGTPRMQDVESHRALYRALLAAFANVSLDIMMVPVPGILNLDELKVLGVNELSINLEIYDEEAAKRIARQKYRYGREYYLDFIEQASSVLGFGKVRSMLLVGLESKESTLRGVEAIAKRGGVPVLSPFRPDPSTPLKDLLPPSYELMYELYLEAQEIAVRHGVTLGPNCPPCTHNTLSFAEDAKGKISYRYGHPNMLVP